MTAVTQYPITLDQKRWTGDDELRWLHLTGEHGTVFEDAVTVINTVSLDELLDTDRVARLEFIWDEPKRGVVLLDARGNVLAHVVNALLGYTGSGPRLSKMILDHVGIDEDTFETIQGAVWNDRPYTVALWRVGPSKWVWERLQ